LVCPVLLGCYQWVRVPPGELAKLDQDAIGNAPRPPGSTEPSTVVQGDDGLVEVRGSFAVKVTTTTRTETFDFNSPIRCVVTPEQLTIAETGTELVSFPAANVKTTEVYHRNATRSSVAIAIGIAVALIPVFLFWNGLKNFDPQSRK
jgi:hypothetical protein